MTTSPLPSFLVPFLLLLPLAGACTSYQSEHYLGRGDVELAKVRREDGTVESYVLQLGMAAHASLQLVTESQRERAFLGVRVTELDKAQADRRGVAPYAGLLVTGTYPRSAAERAGLLAGDVLLAVAGQPVVYSEQLPRVEQRLQPGRTVEASVLRGAERQTLTIEPASLRETVVDPQSIALDEPAPAERPFAGLVLRGVPRVWSERMFGDARNVVVIAGVAVGSPAWVAGFRAGDLIEAVDGRATPPVDELAHEIEARGAAGDTMRLRVRREGIPFEAAVHLDDYLAGSEVWFPLVFHVEDGAAEDHWSIGPFGLLMSNRSHYEPDASSRVASTHGVFSALLGLFRYESGPRDAEVRLLWFITIDV